MRKIFTLLIVAILATATSWAATNTYQHVFESKPSTGNNVMLSNVGWNISGTNIGGFQNSYAGVQLGTSKKNGQITLTSNWMELQRCNCNQRSQVVVKLGWNISNANCDYWRKSCNINRKSDQELRCIRLD